MAMTLDRALEVLAIVTGRAMQGSETRGAYECIRTHLTQPAQSVGVEKVREVIAELHRADSPSPLRFREWADKLEAALQELKP